MTVKSDIERYRTNYLAEQEGSELYQSLAKTERDPHLAELYQRMAETEQHHASIWADYLRKAGEPVPSYTTGWRIRMIIWLAKRFGANSVLPMVSSMESGASHDYDWSPGLAGFSSRGHNIWSRITCWRTFRIVVESQSKA